MEQPDRIGRYEVGERVGRGGMGVLYRGRDPVLEREVAIKVMSGDFSADETARARFFREARAAARLQHRNIVTIYEFAEDHGTPYIAMEFLRGMSLAARLGKEPPLTLVQKLDIVTQLCTGLHYAHEQGIVHRDVKPGNIWVMEDGTIKLLDFGIAKVAASTMTHSGSVLGSASYMAPEQVAGREIDGRADVFAAGVVLYELLAGRKPFEGEAPTAVMMKIIKEEPPPLRQFAPDIPAALVNAVNKALQKDPDRRFMHAGDFGAELRLIRLSLERTSETIFEDAADVAQTVYVPASDTGRAAAIAADPAASASIEGSGSRPITVVQGPGRFSTWIAVAALAVSAVLATIVLLQRTGGAPAAVPEQASAPAAEPARQPAVAAAAVARSSVVKLVSDPSGAAIRIGGQETGLVTPADVAIADLARGLVQISRQGYRETTVRPRDDEIRDGVVVAKLDPVPAGVSVLVTGPYPFEVLQGSTVISRAAARHQLTLPQPATLRLRAPGHLLNVPLRTDSASGRVTYEVPAPGRISVRAANEQCEVWMDGRNFGVVPLAEQPIAPGAHSLELKCPDGQQRSKTITIASGQRLTEIIQ